MAKTGYSKAQVWLHWTIAGGIAFQFAVHEAMVATFEARGTGEKVGSGTAMLADAHGLIGMTILLLAFARLYVRSQEGAPPPPDDGHPALAMLARASHALLYALLFAMPVTGAFAWFQGSDGAADIHEIGKYLLLATLALHVAGALTQHFVFKTNALRRMTKPEG